MSRDHDARGAVTSEVPVRAGKFAQFGGPMACRKRPLANVKPGFGCPPRGGKGVKSLQKIHPGVGCDVTYRTV